MEKLGINLGMLIANTLAFAIVLVVFKAWVYKPILGMMDKRRKMAAQTLEDSRIAAEAKANAESEASKIIHAAQLKSAELIQDATQRAALVEQEQKSKAESEIKDLYANAQNEIQLERERMLGGLRSQIGSLAIAASHKLIGNSLKGNETEQRALLDEFFSGVKNGRFTLVDQTDYVASKAEITSAIPLSDSEKSTLQKDLLSHLDGEKNVEFKVDPAILGGVVVRLDDKVIDGSVSGQLDTMRHNLL